jgi:predicted small lipoprotein YifL
MRNIVVAILVAMLLQACGSKGALFLPSETNSEQQNSSNKQK